MGNVQRGLRVKPPPDFRWQAAMTAMTAATPEQHNDKLQRATGRLRLGPHSERLLWLIHQHVLGARSSVIKVPDFVVRAALWGLDSTAAPRQWRQNVMQILNGLAWLHVQEVSEEEQQPWGADTALLTHVADLRGRTEDACDASCPGAQSPRHHHFLINIGRGFLGTLEQFGSDDAVSGTRTYQLRVSGRKGSGPTLRRAGKTGNVVTVYLAAKLGDPHVTGSLNAGQHRLLQAIVRETTKKPRTNVKETSQAEIVSGNRIRDVSGKGTITCPPLAPVTDYVGFNGNGVRPGLGYHLSTGVGWLPKAGYDPFHVQEFLRDLGLMPQPLGLTVIGVEARSNQCYNLGQLRGMAATPAGIARLNRVCMRVYTGVDYGDRWNQYFRWRDEAPQVQDTGPDLYTFRGEMQRKGISARTLATNIGVDPSFLSKALRGTKRCSPTLLQKAQAWVQSRAATSLPPPAVPSAQRAYPASSSMLETALAYCDRGWSIVPQLPAAKKPTVKWKPFQATRPTRTQLEDWFGRWPDAGLAVVLGPVSGLFVIDVDGPEAHAALMHQLGAEPGAPKGAIGQSQAVALPPFLQMSELCDQGQGDSLAPATGVPGQGRHCHYSPVAA
jgi:Bifunctional DNA primase/polymerase, N-terminal